MQMNDLIIVILLVTICIFLLNNSSIVEGMTQKSTHLKPIDGCAFNSMNIFGGTSKTLVDGDCQTCQGTSNINDKTIHKKYNCPDGFKICGGKPVNINYFDQHCLPKNFKADNSCIYNESIPSTLPYVTHSGEPTDEAMENGKQNWVRCEYAYKHNIDPPSKKKMKFDNKKFDQPQDKHKSKLSGWNDEYYLDYGASIDYDDSHIIPDHINKNKLSQQYNSKLYPQYYTIHDKINETSEHPLNSKKYTMHHRNQINSDKSDIVKLKCKCTQKTRQYPIPSHDDYKNHKKGHNDVHSTNYKNIH